jgi:hypothetical protein
MDALEKPDPSLMPLAARPGISSLFAGLHHVKTTSPWNTAPADAGGLEEEIGDTLEQSSLSTMQREKGGYGIR